MSLRYRANDGTETIVSGLTPGGDIEAGAVATRIGTYDLTGINWVKQNIVFDSPMPDADYEIITEEHNCAGFTSGQFLIENKTANGFTIGIYFTSTTAANNHMQGIWKAIKTYTVQHAAETAEAVANIQAAIPSGAGSANQLVTKSYVDTADNSLDGRLDDIEDIIPTTASITNKLATKDDVDNVEIDVDNALSSTSENPVQNKIVKEAIDAKQSKVFVGTLAQQNALSPATAASYELVSILDDNETGGDQNYTETEKKTGEKQVDGKDIYKISFTIINPRGTLTATKAMTSLNIGTIIKQDTITTWSASGSDTRAYYFPTDVTIVTATPYNYTRQYYTISNKTFYTEKGTSFKDTYRVDFINTVYYTKA